MIWPGETWPFHQGVVGTGGTISLMRMDGMNQMHSWFLVSMCCATAFASAASGVAPASGSRNKPGVLMHDRGSGRISFEYDAVPLFAGTLPTNADAVANNAMQTHDAIEQRIRLTCSSARLEVRGSAEAIAAETRGPAQQTFPMVRTAHGPSSNLRNNAIYDRKCDWMLEFPHGTVISPRSDGDAVTFEVALAADAEIVFRPLYYQRHKNLPYFTPWNYSIRKDSITGWSSWWAYMRNFSERDLAALLDVWVEKRLADYGYRFIQIDDVFQGGTDDGRPTSSTMNGYAGGRPETWLRWRRDVFPSGMTGYVARCRAAGFEPGVWIGCYCSDEETARQHPGWFVQGTDGKPFAGEWVSYAVDAMIPEAADTMVRPIYRGFHDAGFSYVKIDTLRHRLYDNIQHNLEYCRKKGVAPADLFRAYLEVARAELGSDTFLLACWGVLPEAIGLVDACRIGGDGYGPATLQQYNSWNGIVWRNDPDHCDVYPQFKPAETGNVKKTDKVTPISNDTIIRPALASIGGAMLLLSDKPEVYRDDRNLIGLRKSSPVVFSVPGQLYDYDPSKTDRVIASERTSVTNGGPSSPIDADQQGAICPWWLNEFTLPFDHWNVLHHMNWSRQPTPVATVTFADLGLDPQARYLVHEFWSDTFVGVCTNAFVVPACGAMGLQSFAIRALLDRPQLVSTSRHLSQGAVELDAIEWSDAACTLTGRSRVIANDPYTLTFHVPSGYATVRAEIGDAPAACATHGAIVRVLYTPTYTRSIAWQVEFTKQPTR